MIDSRDFIAAKRRAETEVHLPAGPKIAFGGGVDCNDHHAIWAALDKVHAKHADMLLIHGGSPRGAELIASRWADHRKVTQIAFKPDWTREGKAAPFKRNDRMLDVLPIGLVVFPGSGITDNLADKAKKLGIPLMDHRKGGAQAPLSCSGGRSCRGAVLSLIPACRRSPSPPTSPFPRPEYQEYPRYAQPRGGRPLRPTRVP